MSLEELIKLTADNWYTPVKSNKRRRGIGKRQMYIYIKVKNRNGRPS